MIHDAHGWWIREAGGVPPAQPALAEALRADVVVIGGGYTGMWTAWFLKEREPDLDVVLLEADICGGGPSGRNGGFCDGWWEKIRDVRDTYGDGDAMELLMTCGRAPTEIGTWCRANGVDAWFRHAENRCTRAPRAEDCRDAWCCDSHAGAMARSKCDA